MESKNVPFDRKGLYFYKQKTRAERMWITRESVK